MRIPSCCPFDRDSTSGYLCQVTTRLGLHKPTKQYADRVNVIKSIKLGSKWPFTQWSNGGSFAIMSGSQAGTSTIPVAITLSGEAGKTPAEAGTVEYF